MVKGENMETYGKHYLRKDVSCLTIDEFFELIDGEAEIGNDFVSVVDHDGTKIAYFRKIKR